MGTAHMNETAGWIAGAVGTVISAVGLSSLGANVYQVVAINIGIFLVIVGCIAVFGKKESQS